MDAIELLTTNEVDRLLRYSAGRTARLVKSGRIPAIRLPDGGIRIDAAEIKRLLAKAAEGGEPR